MHHRVIKTLMISVLFSLYAHEKFSECQTITQQPRNTFGYSWSTLQVAEYTYHHYVQQLKGSCYDQSSVYANPPYLCIICLNDNQEEEIVVAWRAATRIARHLRSLSPARVPTLVEKNILRHVIKYYKCKILRDNQNEYINLINSCCKPPVTVVLNESECENDAEWCIIPKSTTSYDT